jgi:hypothetical protein
VATVRCDGVRMGLRSPGRSCSGGCRNALARGHNPISFPQTGESDQPPNPPFEHIIGGGARIPRAPILELKRSPSHARRSTYRTEEPSLRRD